MEMSLVKNVCLISGIVCYIEKLIDLKFYKKLKLFFREKNEKVKTSIPEERLYTIHDIYDLLEGKRAELFDGKIYYMAPPSRMHQKLVSFFNTAIANHIAEKNGSCEVYPAPFAVFLDEKYNTYVEPDISVVCNTNILDEKGCHGAPDWIIEVVSPSTKRIDYHIKLFKYRNYGVKEYWIVDAEKQRVTAHDFVGETTEEYSFEDEIPVGLYKDFTIKIK